MRRVFRGELCLPISHLDQNFKRRRYNKLVSSVNFLNWEEVNSLFSKMLNLDKDTDFFLFKRPSNPIINGHALWNIAAVCLASFAFLADGLAALYGLSWYKNTKPNRKLTRKVEEDTLLKNRLYCIGLDDIPCK